MSNSKVSDWLNQGGKKDPFWILGPCVLENRTVLTKVAETLRKLTDEDGFRIVFKASFDKANRTSGESFRGPGMDDGLQELKWVKETFKLPILTDVHETVQTEKVAEVADILQIPAFLSRQSDLLEAACRTGRAVNVKKGQFMSPSMVKPLMQKLKSYGASDFWITERGVSFGYQRLVVDFSAFHELNTYEAPLILDITHAVQLPGGQGDASGGIRDAVPYLARAGAAAGVVGFFAETHPDPKVALSDGPNAWPLDQLRDLMLKVREIAKTAHG